MKRILAVALIGFMAFAVGEFVGATGSDSGNEITSRKSMGIMQYDEGDVRLDSGEADTTSWLEAYSYVNCVTCWLVGELYGDSAMSRVYLQVRNRDHAKAYFLLDSQLTTVIAGTSYVCKQWTWQKPVKEFRFIREAQGGAADDSLWVAEFRSYLGQE